MSSLESDENDGGPTMRRPGVRFLRTLERASVTVLLFALVQPTKAQDMGTAGGEVTTNMAPLVRNLEQLTITISVRDARGLPIDEQATIHLSSSLRRFLRNADTKESADVSFSNVLEGPYDVAVECPGYRPVKEHLDITGGAAFFRAYIYLHPLTDPSNSNGPPKALALSPKAVNEIDKGLAAMRKKDYAAAEKHFTKASTYSPSNSDAFYLKGNAELRANNTDAARKDFEQAIKLEPGHEKALMALGEMQLNAGETEAAITTLNRTVTANGAGWRTYYLLASASAKLSRWKEADSAAQRAVALAGAQSAAPLLLMGEIRLAGGDPEKARELWQRIVTDFPNASQAAEAKARLGELGAGTAVGGNTSAAKIEVESEPEIEESRAWAPPDIDRKEYFVTPEASCDLNSVLNRGMWRMKSQLSNLEKFTAVEHIEHQDVDKRGLAGPIQSREFSYIVFVQPFQKDSVYLEESRGGSMAMPSFPTSLATTGLNSLGLSVLQPVYRPGFQYQCEGVATVRGQAAWQVRFEERKDAKLGVREWQRKGTIYTIPIRGRIWLSTTTFDIMRVETELREPVTNLELTRDHIEVDYGPVNFNVGAQLWLPWNAEMYLEVHGKRYHHKHYLTDYKLFGVDTSTKIQLPKGAAPETEEQPTVPQDKPRPDKPQM